MRRTSSIILLQHLPLATPQPLQIRKLLKKIPTETNRIALRHRISNHALYLTSLRVPAHKGKAIGIIVVDTQLRGHALVVFPRVGEPVVGEGVGGPEGADVGVLGRECWGHRVEHGVGGGDGRLEDAGLLGGAVFVGGFWGVGGAFWVGVVVVGGEGEVLGGGMALCEGG